MILQVRMILHLLHVSFVFIYVVNFAYGWVIVSLVIDSEIRIYSDPNIYLNAKLVIIVIQVVQSLMHCLLLPRCGLYCNGHGSILR